MKYLPSIFTGTKTYLFGDKTCHYDSSVFGLMAQVYWHPFGGFTGSVIKGILCLKRFTLLQDYPINHKHGQYVTRLYVYTVTWYRCRLEGNFGIWVHGYTAESHM